MGLRNPLSHYAEHTTVDNVVIFISDSLRVDYLPDTVREMGISATAISASTFTGSGLPSLITGCYPNTHGIWGFDDQLPATPPLLSEPEHHGYDVNDIWGWPLRVLGLDSPEWEELKTRRLLQDLPEPFVYVFHDKGGHAPYGSSPDEWDSIKEFFEAVSDPAELRRRYARSVDRSMGEFRSLLDTLRERDILDRTLVVLTSDHGELLGDCGGLFGHTKPICPAVVRVPVVFTGAGITRDETFEPLLSTADIAPTAMEACGIAKPAGMDGESVWSAVPEAERRVESQVWQGGPDSRFGAEYMAASQWDADGGIVRHLNSLRRRLPSTVAQYRGSFGPANRSRSPLDILHTFRAHLPRSVRYGSPGFDAKSVKESTPARFEREPERRARDIEPDEEQLRQLGYL